MSAPAKAQTPDALTHEFWKIAEIGDEGELEQLLARGADVNARNEAGMTALMVAACLGRLEMVRALSEHGADLNATDRQGFTAAMLADYAGYEEIVRTLVSRSVKKTPKSGASETPSVRLTQDKVFDDVNDSAGPTVISPEVRTLHEPPDIWNLVPETRVEFDPRSAFFGNITSNRHLMFIVIVLIVSGGAVFGFMKLRGSSGTGNAASTAPAPAIVVPASTAPAASIPAPAASGSAETPARTDDSNNGSGSQDIEAEKIALSSDQQATNTSAIPDNKVNTVASTSGAAASVPLKRGVSRRHRKNPRSLTAIGDATLARTNDEDKTERSVRSSPKFENRAANPPTVKQEDKAPSSKSITPAKASATPKAKVIQWP